MASIVNSIYRWYRGCVWSGSGTKCGRLVFSFICRSKRICSSAYVVFYASILLCTYGFHNVLAYNGSSSWRNTNAFATLLEDDTVQAWGNSDDGGSGMPSGLAGVRTIYSTDRAFAALLGNGKVQAWDSSSYGGSGMPDGLADVSHHI
jgi:hypothetical protein